MRYDDRELAAFARPRHNALAKTELIEHVGMSASGISRRTRRGTLHRVAPEAYVFGSGYLSFDGRARIGAIRGGPGSGVHMEAALALVGAISYEPSTIDVLTPNRRRSDDEVRFRGARQTDIVLVDRNYVPSVSVERALRGLAAVRPVDRLTKLMQSVRYNHRLDMAALVRITEELRYTPGHQTMIAALEAFGLGNNGSWSDIERIGWDLLWDVVEDEMPIQNQLLRIDGKSVYPDMRWGGSQVSVEFDGPPHLYVDAMGDDATKDRRLRSVGDLVIHIPWLHLTQRRQQVREDVLRAILDHRLLVAARPSTTPSGLWIPART